MLCSSLGCYPRFRVSKSHSIPVGWDEPLNSGFLCGGPSLSLGDLTCFWLSPQGVREVQPRVRRDCGAGKGVCLLRPFSTSLSLLGAPLSPAFLQGLSLQGVPGCCWVPGTVACTGQYCPNPTAEPTGHAYVVWLSRVLPRCSCLLLAYLGARCPVTGSLHPKEASSTCRTSLEGHLYSVPVPRSCRFHR